VGGSELVCFNGKQIAIVEARQQETINRQAGRIAHTIIQTQGLLENWSEMLIIVKILEVFF